MSKLKCGKFKFLMQHAVLMKFIRKVIRIILLLQREEKYTKYSKQRTHAYTMRTITSPHKHSQSHTHKEY